MPTFTGFIIRQVLMFQVQVHPIGFLTLTATIVFHTSMIFLFLYPQMEKSLRVGIWTRTIILIITRLSGIMMNILPTQIFMPIG